MLTAAGSHDQNAHAHTVRSTRDAVSGDEHFRLTCCTFATRASTPTSRGEGILRKPLAVACAFLTALVLAPAVFAAPGTTNDVQDAGGTDVESVAHADADGVVKYTVKTFSAVRSDQVSEMTWELDLDGDDAMRGADDACVVLKPVRGTHKLRAGVFEGCEGPAITTADAKLKDRTIKLRLLLSELEDAGLDDDAAGYAYRFTSVARDGARDAVPDDGGSITHNLSGRGSPTTKDVRAAQTTATPTASPTAKPSATPTAKPKSTARDTSSTGTAEESTVEPGEDVDIEGGGFARHKGLQIFLTGNATSTATTSPTPTASASASPTASPTASASPTPSPSPSPAPQSFTRTSSSGTSSGGVVVGQSVGGSDISAIRHSVTAADDGQLFAAAADRVRLGIAISDEDGNFSDDVEIPEGTKAGSYNILVEGPNPRRGTNTVRIPIAVAAQVDDDNAGDPATNVNATGTATQASPVAGGGGGGGNNNGSQLPTTGSDSLQTFFGLGVLALVLGASMVFAKRITGSRPALAATWPLPTAVPMADAPSPWVKRKPARLVFEIPDELRREMQRLLARRADRYDPDRHTDL
jgi:LPXTG-motif cell wall-anchored protein